MTTEEFQSILEEVTISLLDLMEEEGWYKYNTVTRSSLFTHERPYTYDINCGDCENWCCEVWNRVKDKVTDKEFSYDWLPDLPDEDTSHCAVYFRGKYYDSECFEGVEEWDELPCIKNRNRTREEVLIERGEIKLQSAM